MADFDVIVVGSGAAGLNAAWHAARSGSRVLVLNKGMAGRTGATITTGGGVSAAGRSLIDQGLPGDPQDRAENFFLDTIKAGQFLGDQRLVEAMVEGIAPEIRRLSELGTPMTFAKRAPGHSSGRGVHITGPDLQRILLREAVQAGVVFLENAQTTGLVKAADGAIAGVVVLDRAGGEILTLRAKAVVLATGGATSNWPLRTAPEELTGDGHALALSVGAELVEMEMLQFLPCCLVAPAIWRGLQFPWILGPQSGVRAWLLNKYGERFMARWDPDRMELSTRDMVAFASANEVLEGRGGPNGGVFLSFAHLPHEILDGFHTITRTVSADWRWEGFDMKPLVDRIRAGHAVEVAPAAHFSIGGIRVDPDGRTGVPGLFACGEAAGGLHGANRLSGNAGAQILVQGRRAGSTAAAWAAGLSATPDVIPDEAVVERIRAPFHRTEGVTPRDLRDRLVGIAEAAIGPIRDEAMLAQAESELSAIVADDLPRLAVRQRSAAWNRDWSDALEAEAATRVLGAVIGAARARRTSIGAHRRRDGGALAPDRREHGIQRLDGGRLDHRFEPVRFTHVSPGP